MTIEKLATKVVTGKVRLKDIHIFEPTSAADGNTEYRVTILIPKSEKETLRKLKSAIEAAMDLGKCTWGGEVPVLCVPPLREGNKERPGNNAYKNHYVLTASSTNKPGIGKRAGHDARGMARYAEITESAEVYDGCYGKVSLTFYPFDSVSGRGVAASLNNVVKVHDGDVLNGQAGGTGEFILGKAGGIG